MVTKIFVLLVLWPSGRVFGVNILLDLANCHNCSVFQLKMLASSENMVEFHYNSRLNLIHLWESIVHGLSVGSKFSVVSNLLFPFLQMNYENIAKLVMVFPFLDNLIEYWYYVIFQIKEFFHYIISGIKKTPLLADFQIALKIFT